MPPANLNHRAPRTWHKITIEVPASHADTVASFMASISENGVEQLDSPSSTRVSSKERIIFYLEDNYKRTQKSKSVHSFLQQFNKNLPETEWPVIKEELIKEEDWNRRWKEHFKPFKLSERLIIKPSWIPYTPAMGELVLEMDPGMAFGTGLHASTRLAVLLLEQLFQQKPHPNTVLDVGTGTGILGMSCARFGAGKVVGLDHDLDARAAAAENLKTNQLQKIMSISAEELNSLLGLFDLVIANITSDILLELSYDLIKHLASPGYLVLSGILTGVQAVTIQASFEKLGLNIINTMTQGEWQAFALAKRT